MFHSFYDHVGIAAYLEKMAAKGWMLEKVGILLKFRRTEPKKVHFAVTCFPGASQYDPHPSEAQLEMEEFCAMAGWQKVASSAQMQIFCNEEDDPVPLETDALTQIDNIHAAMKKDFLKGQWIFIALALWNLFLRLDQLSRFPTIYHDEVPLTLQDLMEIEDDIHLSSQLYVSQSVLLKITTGQHREVPRDRDTPWIDYRIFEMPGG